MAAPISSVLGACTKTLFVFKSTTNLSKNKLLCYKCVRQASSWSRFFKGSQDEEPDKEEIHHQKLIKPTDSTPTRAAAYGLGSLKKREGLITVRGYIPPDDVESKVLSIAESIVSSKVTSDYRLEDRLIKFKLLTTLMTELDHVIPNTALSQMHTMADVIEFFSTPVKDKSMYEDLTKLDLPKNLHIQLEPLRFDPETDTFFDGKTAFPGRPTIISSLRYRRKFKGNSGESRNQPSVTNYEMQKELDKEREKARVRYFASEGIEKEPNYKRKVEEEVPII